MRAASLVAFDLALGRAYDTRGSDCSFEEGYPMLGKNGFYAFGDYVRPDVIGLRQDRAAQFGGNSVFRWERDNAL
ncbi:hypothetical protein [Phaeobacter sp. 22II1-1F12B]|uniref:hypothetical protein n=1 Tax=Phaeobacter sp. 22II1-1F12B TaxID=1317111 RepID=UPI000B51EBB6|nr:hypothetical protein [Phaeobacter sp. 22II1-1F12B]OWU78163.1 hypothetical protein ATO1_14285 [Phaeobacter sp. 22II1-1F12B]